MIHFEKDGRAFCGELPGAKISNDIITISCPFCLHHYSPTFGFVRDEKERLLAEKKRQEERAAHLDLKAKVRAGLSWQDARALALANRWRELEER